MSIQALHLSHIVIASDRINVITEVFQGVFGLAPHFANEEFSEFVLPSGSRIAFFKPTGKTRDFFSADMICRTHSIGITVCDVDAFYQNCKALEKRFGLRLSGTPKEHPWGEKSFLLIDCDENRWEITQSPTTSGVLITKD